MKEIKTTKHKAIRHIKNLFEHEKDYCKPARLCCLWDNNYIEYETNAGRNKRLSAEKYHIRFRPNLKDLKNF